MKWPILLFLPAFLWCSWLKGQEQLGLRMDLHQGVSALMLNPAGAGTPQLRWEIHLFEIAPFFDNNYAFLSKQDLAVLLKGRTGSGPWQKTPSPEVPDPGYFRKGKPGYFQLSAHLSGPGFFLRLNDRHAVGGFNRIRLYGSGIPVPPSLRYYQYYDRPFFEFFPVNAFQTGLLFWQETALHYSLSKQQNDHRLTLGFNLKFLRGFEAAYWKNLHSFQLAKLPGDSLRATAFSFLYGYTGSNLHKGNYHLAANGNGIGLDAGFSLAFPGPDPRYSSRIGFSFLDLGRIRFFRSAHQHEAAPTGFSQIGAEEFLDIRQLDEFTGKIQHFSHLILGDSSASRAGYSFSMSLPAAFSIQFDQPFRGGFHLGIGLIQSLPTTGTGLNRSNLLAFLPGWKTQKTALCFPLSFYQWNKLFTGFSFRYHILTIGSDNLAFLWKSNRIHGGDFYIALRWAAFRKGPPGSGKEADCYRF